MTAASNIAAIEKATGRAWGDWKAELDGLGAAGLSHAEIVKALAARGGLSGWWCQTIAVAYEQAILRRLPGQRADGRFRAEATRTLAGTPDGLRDRAAAAVLAEPGAAPPAPARRSGTDRRLYWRQPLASGSTLTLTTEMTRTGKVLVTLTEEPLADAGAAERAKARWKGVLAGL
jgi:hypothetical protein